MLPLHTRFYHLLRMQHFGYQIGKWLGMRHYTPFEAVNQQSKRPGHHWVVIESAFWQSSIVSNDLMTKGHLIWTSFGWILIVLLWPNASL